MKGKKMKKLLFIFCLFLAGCSNIDYLCHHKDPNAMTGREFELCKVYLSHSETVITNSGTINER